MKSKSGSACFPGLPTLLRLVRHSNRFSHKAGRSQSLLCQHRTWHNRSDAMVRWAGTRLLGRFSLHRYSVTSGSTIPLGAGQPFHFIPLTISKQNDKLKSGFSKRKKRRFSVLRFGVSSLPPPLSPYFNLGEGSKKGKEMGVGEQKLENQNLPVEMF